MSLGVTATDQPVVEAASGGAAAVTPAARVVAGIPAYHEEATIASIVVLAKQYVDEVVVIDDGSTDDTYQVARMAGATVIRHKKNQGKGRAVRTLLDWCRNQGVQALVMLDGDGQHDPKEIPKVLRPVLDGQVDVSLGIRFGDDTQMPAWRRVGKRALDYTTAAAAGTLTDSQSGFRALGRRAIESLELRTSGFGIESEMIADARQKGMEFAEVPIRCAYGNLKGSTMGPVSHAASVVSSIVRMAGERHPLMVIGVPGLLMFVGGLLMAMRVLAIVQAKGIVAIGSAVAASMLLLAGIMSSLVAVVLHVLPGAIARESARIQKANDVVDTS